MPRAGRQQPVRIEANGGPLALQGLCNGLFSHKWCGVLLVCPPFHGLVSKSLFNSGSLFISYFPGEKDHNLIQIWTLSLNESTLYTPPSTFAWQRRTSILSMPVGEVGKERLAQVTRFEGWIYEEIHNAALYLHPLSTTRCSHILKNYSNDSKTCGHGLVVQGLHLGAHWR